MLVCRVARSIFYRQNLESKAKSFPELSVAQSERLPLVLRASKSEITPYSFSLEESLAELGRFVSYAEQALGSLYSKQLDRREQISSVLSVLRELVRRESGVLNFQDGINLFLQRLWADKLSAQICDQLFRSVREMLYGSTREEPSSGGVELLLTQLSWLIEWYARRKRSLLLIADQESRYRFEADQFDRIFDFHCSEEAQRGGTNGIELSCGLRLYAYKGRALWLRAQASIEGAPLLAKSGRLEWGEEQRALTLVGRSKAPNFAALAPLTIDSTRCLLDRVSIFLPFCEMQLPLSAKNLDLELAVLDEAGTQLLVYSDQLRIDPREFAHAQRIPSFAGLGFWSRDLVGSESISELELSHDPQSSRIIIKFDLELAYYRGKTVELQARIIRADGSLFRPGAFEDKSAAPSKQQLVIPQAQLHPMAVSLDLPFKCSVSDLQDQCLLVELVVSTSAGKVLCGNLRLLEGDLVEPTLENNSLSSVPASTTLGFWERLRSRFV